MPVLEKRQRGRARFRCLLRGPDCPLGAWVLGLGGELRVALSDAGMVFVGVVQRSDWSKELRSPTCCPSGLLSSVQRDSLSQRVSESLQAAALASLGE